MKRHLPPPRRPHNPKKGPVTRQYLNLSVMLLLLVVITLLFFDLMRSFLFPILLALIFSTLFYPLFARFSRLVHLERHKGPASALFCLLLVILIVVPLILLGRAVVAQAVSFYTAADKFIRTALREGTFAGTFDWLVSLQNHNSAIWLQERNLIPEINWPQLLNQALSASGRLATFLVNRTSSGLLSLSLTLFLMLYTMFYFFMDGPKIVDRLRYLSPLRDEYEEQLIDRFTEMSRATIKGTLVIGLIQAFFGTLTFLLFGVSGWLLWGVVMLVLSIIPLVGMILVMAPVGIWYIMTGHVWQGVVMFIVGIVVNYAIEYTLRPRLVGRDSKMHDLLVFFSTMGGLAAFGATGFIIGPVIAILFVTILDIYGSEFKELL